MQRKMLKEYPRRDTRSPLARHSPDSPLASTTPYQPHDPTSSRGLVRQEFRRIPVNDIPDAVVHKDKRYPITLPDIGGVEEIRRGSEDGRDTGRLRRSSFVYARNQALKEMGAADPAGQANASTFASDGRTLDIYSMFTTQLPPRVEMVA